ncbi:MAG: hypothetical protein AB1762_14850 [Gemmatimonadota bacterium]
MTQGITIGDIPIPSREPWFRCHDAIAPSRDTLDERDVQGTEPRQSAL